MLKHLDEEMNVLENEINILKREFSYFEFSEIQKIEFKQFYKHLIATLQSRIEYCEHGQGD